MCLTAKALIVSYMQKYSHLAEEKQPSGPPQMQPRRPPLEKERCFSFVLIRHSQSSWLRGCCCCEIMSLIKRPVWYGHTQSWDTPQRSKPPPPSFILLFFIFFYLPNLEERKECCSCLKWPRCSLTHLNRWKSISVAFEAGDTVAQQHQLSTADGGVFFCCWENAAQKKRNKCCHRALVCVWEELGLLLRSAGHSQRAPAELLINECAMKTETQLSTIQYFPSPPVMCIESHRSISYMQSSTELKGL